MVGELDAERRGYPALSLKRRFLFRSGEPAGCFLRLVRMMMKVMKLMPPSVMMMCRSVGAHCCIALFVHPRPNVDVPSLVHGWGKEPIAVLIIIDVNCDPS